MNIAGISRVKLGGTWYDVSPENGVRFPLLGLGAGEVHCVAFTDKDGAGHRAPLSAVQDMIAGEAPDGAGYRSAAFETFEAVQARG
jgi:hypothetical protein